MLPLLLLATQGKAATGVVVAPLAPSGLVAVAAGPNSIALTWNDNSEVETGHRIERRSPSGSGGYTVAGTVSANLRAFLDVGLTPNTNYGYQVFALNSAGDSPPTAEAVATTFIVPATPSAFAQRSSGIFGG